MIKFNEKDNLFIFKTLMYSYNTTYGSPMADVDDIVYLHALRAVPTANNCEHWYDMVWDLFPFKQPDYNLLDDTANTLVDIVYSAIHDLAITYRN